MGCGRMMTTTATVAFQELVVSRGGASIYEEHRAIRVIARVQYQNLTDEVIGWRGGGSEAFR